MNSNTFYAILIDSEWSNEESFVQVFWTWANHIGDALSKVLGVVHKENLKNPIAREIDPYDFESLPDEVYEIDSTGIFTKGTQHSYPVTPCLNVPKGVILSAIEGDFDAEDLLKGYLSYLTDDGFHCIDAVLPDEELTEFFLHLVGQLPGIKVCWVEILEEWENAGKRQLFTNEALNTPEKIKEFLEMNEANIIQNGFLKFTVYCNEGATNLVITDHKEISLLSRSKRIQLLMEEKMEYLKIDKSTNLRSLKTGYHHWHFRPSNTFNRNELISYLINNGFTLWKET